MKRFIFMCFSLTMILGIIGNLTNVGAEEDLIIADFEGWPNNVGGEMGVYGSLEPNWAKKETVPYSWCYTPKTPMYTEENVYQGKQSWRLVNALGAKPDENWGSFAMDLGPTVDLTKEPKKIDSLDVSNYKYLTFWIKGKKGGEHLEVLFRDAHAPDYMPQVKYKVPDATTEWQKVVIPLSKIKNKVDLTKLDNIGIAFGPDVGNKKGAIIYMDYFVFTNTK